MFHWHPHTQNSRLKKTFYARATFPGKRGEKRASILLHKLVTSFAREATDHADNDTHNNTKANLRPCTNSQNMQNRAAMTGARLPKGVRTTKNPKMPFAARIVVKGKRVHLGVFKTPEEAAKAYDSMATTFFGEFARTNFSPENVNERLSQLKHRPRKPLRALDRLLEKLPQ